MVSLLTFTIITLKKDSNDLVDMVEVFILLIKLYFILILSILRYISYNTPQLYLYISSIL